MSEHNSLQGLRRDELLAEVMSIKFPLLLAAAAFRIIFEVRYIIIIMSDKKLSIGASTIAILFGKLIVLSGLGIVLPFRN